MKTAKRRRGKLAKGRSFFFPKVKITRYKTHTVISIKLPRLLTKTKSGKALVSKQPEKIKVATRRSNLLQGVTLIIISLAGFGFVLMHYIGNNSFSSLTAATNLPATSTTKTAVLSLSRSLPVHISIPSIQVEAPVVQVSKNADGSLGVPPTFDKVGWYRHSPTPGEIGPAIIDGHLTSFTGDAIFKNLNKLTPNDVIKVKREDQQVAIFRVDSVAHFRQSEFPTKQVYGNINYAGLRLITCGGAYNYLTGRYELNTVIYASLTEN